MGGQYELTGALGGHAQLAVVNQVGASLRRLAVDGNELVQDYPREIAAPSAAGVVLVPWPNRVAGGTWMHQGRAEQLRITEPKRGNAIHGLLRHSSYREIERTEARVVLAADISPAPGYPFTLATTVVYELVADGLRVTHSLENTGTEAAPVAVGAHPYLRVGDTPVAELTLVIDAARHVEVNELMIPTGKQPAVAGTTYDYRSGRRLGGVVLDDAWTDLGRDAQGGSTHYLEASDGSAAELHMDANYGFIQAFTTTTFKGPAGPMHAVAMEPMTAAADAFNNGLGLRWLAPGEIWEPSWGIRYRPAAEPPREKEVKPQ